MSTIKISQLPNASIPLSGTEQIPLVQNGVTKKALVAAILPFANVKLYGAIGDGVTDDTAAIQAAVNASDGVFFPTGTYLVSSAINLKTNSNVFGEGASSVILYTGTAASQGALYANSGSATTFVNNICISDLKLVGQSVAQPFYEFGHLISLNGVRNCVVQRCVLEAFRGDGVYIGSGDVAGQERHNINVTVRDCYIDGVNKNNRNGISVVDGDKVTIENNYITRTSASNMPGGIDIEPDANAYHVIRDISIVNNKVVDCGGNVAAIGVYLPGVTYAVPPNGIVISNNYVDTFPNGFGIFFNYDVSGGISEATANFGLRIDNNFVTLPNSLGRGIGVWNCNDTVVSDNTFIGGGTSFIGYTGANHNVLDCVFRNNSFIDVRGAGNFALSIFKGSRITLEGNLFKRCGAAAGATRGAIEFNVATTSYVTLINNTVVDPGGLYTQQAIRDESHTFTPATNILWGNNLLAGTNQFQSLYNDVAETSWTPVVEGGGTAGTGTYTLQFGRYRQVGNLVFFRLKVSVDAGHTGTGIIEAGLPTPVQAELNNEETMVAVNADGVSSTGGIVGAINPAAAVGANGAVRFYKTQTGSTADIDIPAGAFTLYATGFYVRA